MPTFTQDCTDLLKALETANCQGIDAPGGVDGRVYFGNLRDVATCTFGANKQILTLTLKAGTVLYKCAGKPEKHDIKWTTVQQEPRNVFAIAADLFFFPYTDIEVDAIESHALAKRKFVIYETADGRLKVIGLTLNPFNGKLDLDRGVNGSLEGGEGAVLTASKEQKISYTGNNWTIPRGYKPAATLDANIAELDALCVEE